MLSRLIKVSAAIAGIVAIAGVSIAEANAQSARVRNACTADARRLCPQYKAGTSELRYCMESRGRSLSHGCVMALEDEGIVPRGTLLRERARRS